MKKTFIRLRLPVYVNINGKKIDVDRDGSKSKVLQDTANEIIRDCQNPDHFEAVYIAAFEAFGWSEEFLDAIDMKELSYTPVDPGYAAKAKKPQCGGFEKEKKRVRPMAWSKKVTDIFMRTGSLFDPEALMQDINHKPTKTV